MTGFPTSRQMMSFHCTSHFFFIRSSTYHIHSYCGKIIYFCDRALCSLSWPWICHLAENDLEVFIPLSPPPQRWGYKHVPSTLGDFSGLNSEPHACEARTLASYFISYVRKTKFKNFVIHQSTSIKIEAMHMVTLQPMAFSFVDAGATIKKVSLAPEGLIRALGIQLSPRPVSVDWKAAWEGTAQIEELGLFLPKVWLQG